MQLDTILQHYMRSNGFLRPFWVILAIFGLVWCCLHAHKCIFVNSGNQFFFSSYAMHSCFFAWSISAKIKERFDHKYELNTAN